MSQKSHTRLLAATCVGMLAALTALVAMRSSASLAGKKRSEALAELPNYNTEALVAGIAIIAFALLIYFYFGRDHKPAATGSPWDLVTNTQVQPALMGRLTRLNAPDADDITATVLFLAQKGAIRVSAGARRTTSGKDQTDYLLKRVDEVAERCESPVERATLDLLFEIAGEGASAAWLSDVHSFGRQNYQFFTQAVTSWQTTLTREMAERSLFDSRSKTIQLALAVCSGGSFLCGLLLLLATHSFIPLAFLAIAGVVCALVARRMPRLTQHGATLLAQAEDLRAWLNEMPESQPKACNKTSEEWANLMPYAFVLGKASDTIDALIRLNPDALASNDAESNYSPWVFWYSESFADTQQLASAQRFASAQQLASAQMHVGSATAEQAHNSQRKTPGNPQPNAPLPPEGLPHFARAVSNCICGTAFAAAATEASAQLRALNNPMQGALSGGGIPEVGGISTGPSPTSSRMR